MSFGGAAVKLASHDLQLATLISMGFEANAAEQALERNNWNVSESIDYLLAAGIGMNDRASPPVDDDGEKSVERQRLDISASTMIPTVASNSIRQPLPTIVEDRSRGHGTQDQLGDGWIDEPNMNAAPTISRGRSIRRGDGSVGSADLTPPRRTSNVSPSREIRDRGFDTGPRHAHFEDDPLEQPRYSRANIRQSTQTSRQTTAQDTNEYHDDPRYIIPPEPRHLPITYNEQDFKPPDASFEDRLGDGFSTAGVPTMATEGRNKKKRRNQRGSEAVDHGVHVATIQESFPGARRQVGVDDVSMVAMAGSTVSPLTGMPSIQEAQCEDAAVSRKDIRRLYMLVCAAIVLVVVAIVVTLSLVFTIGKSAPAPVDASGNTGPTSPSTPSTLPPPRPTTSGPLPIPTPATVDNSTQAPAKAPNVNGTEPTESSNAFEPSPAPIFSLFAPTDPPGGNRRVEQRRKEKSQHHLRNRGLSDGQ